MKLKSLIKKAAAFLSIAAIFAGCSNLLNLDKKDSSKNSDGSQNVNIFLSVDEPSVRQVFNPAQVTVSDLTDISVKADNGGNGVFEEKATASGATVSLFANSKVKVTANANGAVFSGEAVYTSGSSLSITLAASGKGILVLNYSNPQGADSVKVYVTNSATIPVSFGSLTPVTDKNLEKNSGAYTVSFFAYAGSSIVKQAYETAYVQSGFKTTVNPSWAEDVAIYTVTFNPNYSGGQSKTVRVKAGTAATAPEFTRSGMEISGWYTDSGCTAAATLTNITSNKTVYAKWESASSKVALWQNGSKKAEYDTVKEALAACGSSGDFKIVLPKGTYNENGLTYNGSGTIRICGDTTTKYGTDVVIKGHGSTMPVDGGSSAQNARELILFKGTGNLILENLTLQTDWLRAEHPGVSAMQAEVLGFNSSGNVAAYNCSFNSYQDTVRTVGKGWFYNCHIEGDVDFIWMEAGGKVALYEKCDIASVYDGKSSAAYIAAPKINLGNVAGKGVVIKDCTVTAASGQQTYLFRNPWSSKPTEQYNQAAFVDCTYSGTFVAGLSKSDANGTADQQYIGWKIDSAAASKFTGKSSTIGVLSDDVKSKEYSGRRAILNRNYMVDSAKFEKDTSSFWDIDAFISTVGWSVQTDNSQDKYDGEVETKIYSWDMVANAKPGAGYLASAQDSNVKLYLSANGGGDGCPCYHPASGSKVYIPASVGDKIEVTTHSGNYYGYTLGGTAATSSATEITVASTVSSGQSGDTKTYVLLEVTGSCYIHSITVTGNGDGTDAGDGGETGEGGAGSTGGGETGGGEGSSEDLYITFENGPVASDSRVSSASNKVYSDTSFSTYNGVEYTYGVKLNSTGSMTVTLEKSYTVVFVMGTDKATYSKGLTIDSTVVDPVENIVTANLAAGTHTIKNGGSETSVYLVILKGAGSTTGGGTTPSTPVVTSVTLSKTSLSLTAGGSETITATVNGTNLTDTSVTWSTNASGVATVNNGQITAVAAGTATITATSKADTSKKATCTVTVTAAGGEGGGTTPAPSGNVIKASDVPLGFAGVNFNFSSIKATTASKGSYSAPVTTRAELVEAVSKGGIIYISGMIDMSDEGSGSKLPEVGAKNTDVSSVMDDWISSKTSGTYATYKAWITAYSAAVGKSTDDKKVGNSGNSTLASTLWKLNNAWQSVIQLNMKSNTILIGLGDNSGVRGGTFSINGISNVVIRNLHLIDAIDMFPHHEKGDGYNSQFDCITIQGSNTANIWIDHCTFEDTMLMQHVTNGLDSSDEKWQNYDGSCDIKGDAKGVTVSNCHFFKHDKTMLIGSDDGEGNNTVRKISLINNYFDSCVQRLPMVRNSQIHVLNNYYDFNKVYTVGDGKNKMSYAIGIRSGSRVYSQGNYFASNMNAAYANEELDTGKASSDAWYFVDGDGGESKDKTNFKQSSSAILKASLSELGWTPPYSYTPMTAVEAKAYASENSGHGVWSVQQ